MTFDGFNGGNCSFAVKPDGRFRQDIDLRLYSLLIDNGRAGFNASALMGCDRPGEYVYMSVGMHHRDGIIQGHRQHLNKSSIKQSFSTFDY